MLKLNKKFVFSNSLLAILYCLLLNTNQRGIYAILIVVTFAMGIMSQIVWSGIFRPTKINLTYILINTLRAILFLTLPKQKPIFSVFYIIGFVLLDLVQFSFSEINPAFNSPVTKQEKAKAIFNYKHIIIVGALLAAYIQPSMLSIFLMFIACFKSKHKESFIKYLYWFDCAVVTVLITIKRIINFNEPLDIIIFISLLVLLVAQQYYVLKNYVQKIKR